VFDAKACASAIEENNVKAVARGAPTFRINWPGDVADMAALFALGAEPLRARFVRADIPKHMFGEPFPGFDLRVFKTTKILFS